jgi:hypothetical protein
VPLEIHLAKNVTNCFGPMRDGSKWVLLRPLNAAGKYILVASGTKTAVEKAQKDIERKKREVVPIVLKLSEEAIQTYREAGRWDEERRVVK